MDLAAAQKAAKSKDLPILLNFSGSDWCSVCWKINKTVFLTDEWKSYAKDKLMLVNIDSPRDTTVLPEQYRERNKKLVAKYKVEGYPSFVILDSDGTLISKFGMKSDMHGPYAFVRKIGDILRYRGPERLRIQKSLTKEGAEAYQTLAAEWAEIEREFESWLAEKPERSEKNTKRFNSFTEQLKVIDRGLLEKEMSGLLHEMGGDRWVESMALLLTAAELTEAMASVAEARTNLEDWLFSRPVNNRRSRSTLKKMTKELQTALARLDEVRSW